MYDHGVKWPWSPGRPENLSVADPALAAFFGLSVAGAGVPVTESTALGLSAVWRSVNLIAGTLATLPLRTLKDTEDGRERVAGLFDNPGAPIGLRPFQWKRTSIAHLVTHGNIFWAHLFNNGGGLAGLLPLHPLAVTVDWERDPETGAHTGRKVFDASFPDGRRRRYTPDTMTHVTGLCLDGLRGLSPISVARLSLGKGIAADRAAARAYSDGFSAAGMVTPEGDADLSLEDATKIQADLNSAVGGWENAGKLAVINRRLKVDQWSMSLEDAQFLQSRAFEIEEVCRWFGVPPHLLAQTEKQTSWGMGVESQNRGLGRFTLVHYSAPVEEACTGLTGPTRTVEFDYAGLERPTPEQEIQLLIAQVQAGLLTPNEARRIRNLPPVPGGDTLRTPSGTPQGAVAAPDPAGVPG
jgi:HK97 family phage portal protein